jgi:dTDP-N-acetylfucosamine:lipid II N-acetylfucosaminyltransferase
MQNSGTNYHLMIDDKFIDDFILDANSIIDNNKYIFTFNSPAKYVTYNNVIHAPYGSEDLYKAFKSITENDKLFIHFYSPLLNEYLSLIPKKTKVYLLFWGADFFEVSSDCHPNNRINRSLYDKLTFSLIINDFKRKFYLDIRQKIESAINSNNTNNIIHTYFVCLKLLISRFLRISYRHEIKNRSFFLKRIEAVCHWNNFDIQQLNDIYSTKLNSHYFIYNIGNIEEQPTEKSKDSPLTFWLGNSDTETNNHLDALEHLKVFKDDHIKIICPLNYGNKTYSDFIASKGNEIFGDKFIAIQNFIPRDQYYKMMNSVDAAIMFHNRSQAGGNIIAFLMKGKKIYMKEKSNMYNFFKSKNIHIYSNIDLKSDNFLKIKAPLSLKKIKENRSIIQQSIGNQQYRINSLKKLLTI